MTQQRVSPVVITSLLPATTTQTIRGAVGQSASLQQWQDSSSNILGAITMAGVQLKAQPTPTAKTGNATLTIAELLTGIVTATSSSAVALTLPTGTLSDAGFFALSNNIAFDWSVINLGSVLGAVTMTAGTDHTYVGNATVAINTSAQFRSRRTATNTWVSYRLA